jgi:hypothetical protein
MLRRSQRRSRRHKLVHASISNAGGGFTTIKLGSKFRSADARLGEKAVDLRTPLASNQVGHHASKNSMIRYIFLGLRSAKGSFATRSSHQQVRPCPLCVGIGVGTIAGRRLSKAGVLGVGVVAMHSRRQSNAGVRRVGSVAVLSRMLSNAGVRGIGTVATANPSPFVDGSS